MYEVCSETTKETMGIANFEIRNLQIYPHLLKLIKSYNE